jgi:hypothetical protein
MQTLSGQRSKKREMIEFCLKSSVLHFWGSINSLHYVTESTEIVTAKAPRPLRCVCFPNCAHTQKDVKKEETNTLDTFGPHCLIR